MTDNEIVKMLECCKQEIDINGVICGECKKCPNYEGKTGLCKEDLPTVVLDLINRLQAENERLKNAYKQCAWERDIFAEDMTQEIKKDCSFLMLDIKTIKTEAYKEFAERLKEKKSVYNADDFYWIKYIPERAVDNLLKELVGENDARQTRLILCFLR